MPSMTVLQVVQKTLNAMTSDDVNSIDDTEESITVSHLVEDIFYEYITDERFRSVNRTFQLNSDADTTKPTELQVPTDITRIDSIYYNKKLAVGDVDLFRDVIYLEPAYFIDMCLNRNDDSTAVDSVSISETDNISILVFNDRHPTYWTTLDQTNVVFDSHLSTLDTKLQSDKTFCRGLGEPQFSRTDSHVIQLPTDVMPAFLAEVKTAAFETYKQQDNVHARVAARRGRSNSNYMADKVNRALRMKDYPIGRS